MMALENTSVTYSHLSVPGIFISDNSLDVTIEEGNEQAKSSPDLDNRAISEEEWRRPDTDDEYFNDSHSASTLPDVGITPASPLPAGDNSNDLSDAFTPVTPRHRKHNQASKMGVRLAVVSSGDFAKIQKPTLYSEKQRASKYHRAAISLKATALTSATGTATYKEVDYQNMKKLNPRPCHKHYLAVTGCPNQDRCNFGHHYQLTKSELLAVRVLAREMCCPYYLAGKCPHDVSARFILLPLPNTDHLWYTTSAAHMYLRPSLP